MMNRPPSVLPDRKTGLPSVGYCILVCVCVELLTESRSPGHATQVVYASPASDFHFILWCWGQTTALFMVRSALPWEIHTHFLIYAILGARVKVQMHVCTPQE